MWKKPNLHYCLVLFIFATVFYLGMRFTKNHVYKWQYAAGYVCIVAYCIYLEFTSKTISPLVYSYEILFPFFWLYIIYKGPEMK